MARFWLCMLSFGEVVVWCSALCEGNWSEYGNMCYMYHNSLKTYPQAKSVCALDGAQTVSVHSLAQHEFLRSIVPGGLLSHIWIGLELANSERIWSDGSNLTFTYWLSGQPDGDECTVMWNQNPDSKWSAVDCEEIYGFPFLAKFICQRNPQTTMAPPMTSETTSFTTVFTDSPSQKTSSVSTETLSQETSSVPMETKYQDISSVTGGTTDDRFASTYDLTDADTVSDALSKTSTDLIGETQPWDVESTASAASSAASQSGESQTQPIQITSTISPDVTAASQSQESETQTISTTTTASLLSRMTSVTVGPVVTTGTAENTTDTLSTETTLGFVNTLESTGPTEQRVESYSTEKIPKLTDSTDYSEVTFNTTPNGIQDTLRPKVPQISVQYVDADDRPSAVGLGVTAVLILVIFIGVLIAGDLNTLKHQITGALIKLLDIIKYLRNSRCHQ